MVQRQPGRRNRRRFNLSVKRQVSAEDRSPGELLIRSNRAMSEWLGKPFCLGIIVEQCCGEGIPTTILASGPGFGSIADEVKRQWQPPAPSARRSRALLVYPGLIDSGVLRARCPASPHLKVAAASAFGDLRGGDVKAAAQSVRAQRGALTSASTGQHSVAAGIRQTHSVERYQRRCTEPRGNREHRLALRRVVGIQAS